MSDKVITFARQALAEHKSAIDRAMAEYFEIEFKRYNSEFTEFSEIAMNSLKETATIGGKRLRGSLLIHAYYAAGGKDEEVALRAAVAIETVHAYLLILDDFIDESKLRRGVPTAHRAMKNYFTTHKLQGDSEHFGESVAVTIGAAGMHFASNLIAKLDVPEKHKLQAMIGINNAAIKTAHGQLNDLYEKSIDPVSVTEEDILSIMSLKTGYYTFYSPLNVGSLLAGMSRHDAQDWKKFSLLAGRAFQIQDDIIGIFGVDSKTGKSNLDDMREGKITLLVRYALDSCNESDCKFILENLGNKEITQSDLDKIKNIFESSGALERAKQQASKYSKGGLKELEASGLNNNNQKEYLIGLTGYIIERDL